MVSGGSARLGVGSARLCVLSASFGVVSASFSVLSATSWDPSASSLNLSASYQIYRQISQYISAISNISATFHDISATSQNGDPPFNKKRATPRAARLSKPNKITLSTLNTHIIINKDQLRGFSLPLLLLLHSQLMFLVHILIDRIHDLEQPLFSYFPFLSFSFEDLLAHGVHTLHRLV